MKQVCLDTSLLIDLERGNPSAKTMIEDLLSSSYRLATTTINIFEMAFGAHKSKKKKQNLRALVALTRDLDIWDFDLDSSFLAGEISQKLESSGTPVGFRDVFIASIALSNGSDRIVTSNVKDFEKIPRVKVIRYKP